MGWHTFAHAFLALIFVIGLLLLTVWLLKYCQQKGLNGRLIRKINAGQKIGIIETHRIDARHTLVLCRCGQTEYLLLLGAASDLLVDRMPLRKKGDRTDE